MNTSTLVLVFSIGLIFWGGWPLIAQGSKLEDPFVRGFLVNAVVAIGFIPFLPGRISIGTITSTGFWLLLLAGAFNFAGHALFQQLQTMAGSQLSKYMVVISGLCVIASALGGPLFYGDAVTLPKTFFTLLILLGIIGLAFTS